MTISIISVSLDSSKDSVGTPAGRVILFSTIPTTILDTTLSMTSPTTHIDTIPIPIVSPTIPPSPDYTPASPDCSPASDMEFDPSNDPLSDHIPPLPTTLPFLSSTDDSLDSYIPDTPPSPTHGTPFTETTFSTQRSHTASGALRHRVMILAPRQPIPHGRPYLYHPNRPVHMMTTRKRVGPLPTHHLAMRHSVDYSSLDHFSSDDSSSIVHLLIIHYQYHHRVRDLTIIYVLWYRVFTVHLLILRDHLNFNFFVPSRKRSRSPVASVPLYSPTLRALLLFTLLNFSITLRGKENEEVGLGVDFEDKSSEPSRSRGTDLEMDVDVVRNRGIDARFIVESIDREEIETGMRGPVEVRVDRVTHPVEIPVHRIQAIESVQKDQGHRIVAIGQQSADMELCVQRELRQIRHFRFYDRIRIARLEAYARRIMPNTRSGASRTREGVNEQSDRRMAEALRVRNAVKNLGPLMGDEGEQGEVNINGGNKDRGNGNRGNRNRGNRNGGNRNGGNGNGGNGNGNGNGGEYGYNFRGFMPARECTYQDFLKCQPLNFNGTEGVVGLTHWFKKMEIVFPTISKCPREVPRNDLTAYTRRFQDLVLLCTRMVPSEEDKVERFIGELPDNIQGNVIVAEATKLQDAIRFANNLMDQKLKGYARSVENKRRLDNNPRDNQGQLPVFKRQNVGGQNVARAYMVRNNEKKGYVGSLPYCNKCKSHHAGPCTVRPGHFRKDCPKLRNQNRGNKTGNKNGNKTENQTGGNKATVRAYAIGGGGTNPDSNVFTGMFLLNNCHASMLFDSGADRSFVSSTFSALLDVAPSILDTSYAVELADGRILETNVVIRGCTLGLLGHPFDIDLMPLELGSFNVIIGMDWLVKYHALIVCDKKVVRIPWR
ncbi:putative reverse transcriptase domain-containing protein [Tanacetum coccineum]